MERNVIRKFTVSRDDGIYEAFPDVALAPSGRLVCVFSECTHHHNRDYTRNMVADSTDRGRRARGRCARNRVCCRRGMTT